MEETSCGSIKLVSCKSFKINHARRKVWNCKFPHVSTVMWPSSVGFFQFLRNFHQLTAFEQAEMILYAALDPSIASKAKKGEFVKCLDHFGLLQSARN